MVSTDNGLNFSNLSQDIRKFSKITNVKFILEDQTDPENPITINELESVSLAFGSVPGKYIVTFDNDLSDGSYTLSVMDDEVIVFKVLKIKHLI